MTPAALRGRHRPAPRTHFAVPENAHASSPPEARGLARDEVRLMVASPEGVTHSTFRRLADHLEPGDLLVVNTSATLAAAVDARRRSNGQPVVVHFSGPARGGGWVVELRDAQLQRLRTARAEEQLDLPRGAVLTLHRAWPDPTQVVGSRLWVAQVAIECSLPCYLEREGHPITYRHITGQWPLSHYQTVFAEHPGSAEMVSAARPFSFRVLADLQLRRIGVASLVLHTGVSSLEADELPLPERYRVPSETARRVNETRASGGRIVAVGTTATRALETVTDEDGHVSAGEGVTDLVIGPDRRPWAIDGLVTGWHEPEASHLLLLEAVAGPALVRQAYDAALDSRNGGYLWHEFGDSCLFLPTPRRR
jgi:S-adenosylmethionine:tRNA ribosyltransferase-isomerase